MEKVPQWLLHSHLKVCKPYKQYVTKIDITEIMIFGYILFNLGSDLIPVIYRIAKKENRPMTKILYRFVRDSIGRYIAENGD